MSFEFDHKNIELHELPLTSRIIRILHENEIVYFNQYVKLSLAKVYTFKSFGSKSLAKTIDCLNLLIYSKEFYDYISKFFLWDINFSNRSEYYFFMNDIFIVTSKFFKETKFWKEQNKFSSLNFKRFEEFDFLEYLDESNFYKEIDKILKNKKFQKELYERPFIKNYLK